MTKQKDLERAKHTVPDCLIERMLCCSVGRYKAFPEYEFARVYQGRSVAVSTKLNLMILQS